MGGEGDFSAAVRMGQIQICAVRNRGFSAIREKGVPGHQNGRCQFLILRHTGEGQLKGVRERQTVFARLPQAVQHIKPGLQSARTGPPGTYPKQKTGIIAVRGELRRLRARWDAVLQQILRTLDLIRHPVFIQIEVHPGGRDAAEPVQGGQRVCPCTFLCGGDGQYVAPLFARSVLGEVEGEFRGGLRQRAIEGIAYKTDAHQKDEQKGCRGPYRRTPPVQHPPDTLAHAGLSKARRSKGSRMGGCQRQ